MIVACERCRARFRLDTDAIAQPKVRLQCARCAHPFIVRLRPEAVADIALRPEQMVRSDQVVAFCNQKGGVGKTTSCLNIALALVEAGYRVLLVDFDTQASLTTLCGAAKDARSLYDIADEGTLADALVKIESDLWLLPSNSRMELLPRRFVAQKGHEQVLAKALATVKGEYDYVLVDTPPALRFFTLNALAAADVAIVPTQSALLSMNGVAQIEQAIKVIRSRTGRPTRHRLLITMYDADNTAAQAVYTMLDSRYGDQRFGQPIPADARIQEAQILNRSLFVHAPDSDAASAYRAVAAELEASLR